MGHEEVDDVVRRAPTRWTGEATFPATMRGPPCQLADA